MPSPIFRSLSEYGLPVLCRSRRFDGLIRALDRLFEVGLVYVGSDEIQPKPGARHRGAAQAEKRIHDDSAPCDAVKPQTHFRQLRRKGRWMRAVAIAPLDGLVRDEPRVTPAAHAVAGRPPTPDVRLVLVRHSE